MMASSLVVERDPLQEVATAKAWSPPWAPWVAATAFLLFPIALCWAHASKLYWLYYAMLGALFIVGVPCAFLGAFLFAFDRP